MFETNGLSVALYIVHNLDISVVTIFLDTTPAILPKLYMSDASLYIILHQELSEDG